MQTVARPKPASDVASIPTETFTYFFFGLEMNYLVILGSWKKTWEFQKNLVFLKLMDFMYFPVRYSVMKSI